MCSRPGLSSWEANMPRDFNRDWALRLAEAGMAVFPCGPDKKPLIKWRTLSSSDPEAVAQMVECTPRRASRHRSGKMRSVRARWRSSRRTGRTERAAQPAETARFQAEHCARRPDPWRRRACLFRAEWPRAHQRAGRSAARRRCARMGRLCRRALCRPGRRAALQVRRPARRISSRHSRPARSRTCRRAWSI